MLRNIYNLTDEEQQINPVTDPEYQDNILFHINFHESEEKIGGIPRNITYELVYNTTILDETIRRYPDEISKTYKNNLLQPFWTSYTFTLQ